MTEVQAAPVVKVAQDLTAIADLCERLLTPAVHTANDRELPGGEALVALGAVADPHAYAENVEAAEYRHATNPRRWPEQTLDMAHEDDDLAPVLQILWYWSCALRDNLGFPLEGRHATVASEANVIRQTLDHIWDTEPRFDALAADVRGARRRLENILAEGLRAQHGVPCFDCGVDLVRYSDEPREPSRCDGHDGVCYWPHKFCPHNRGGLVDEWVCPKCRRLYDAESYHRAVAWAHLIHADALTADQMHQQYGIRPGTLFVWANRGQVAKRGQDHSGRKLYDVAQAIAARDGERQAGACVGLDNSVISGAKRMPK